MVLHITIFAFYNFNLLTDLQYNNIKFKKLFIDSSTLIQSKKILINSKHCNNLMFLFSLIKT